MADNSIQKGRELEMAVELIENAILRNNPSLKNRNFKVERGKIIVKDGVRSEIDIYVEYDVGVGHKSIYIFECKNWKSKISTKEIDTFSRKIEDNNAQIGYFVAKSYTKDSINLANRYKRMTLLLANDVNIDFSAFPNTHIICINPISKNIHIKSPKIKGRKERKILDIKTISATYHGTKIELLDFLKDNFDEMIQDRLKNESTEKFPDGVYRYSAEKNLVFTPSELMVDNYNVESIKLKIEFDVLVVKPIIKSKFDVHKRGRVISFEPFEAFPGNKIDISYVESI